MNTRTNGKEVTVLWCGVLYTVRFTSDWTGGKDSPPEPPDWEITSMELDEDSAEDCACNSDEFAERVMEGLCHG